MDQLNNEECYKVDDLYLLYIKEKEDGFDYRCIQIDNNQEIAKGIILWEDVEKCPAKGIMASARSVAIYEIGLAGEKISSF